MSRIDDIAKLKEDMTEFTKSITSTLGTVGVLNPEGGTNIAIMALMGAYIEQMSALNETMAMIYEDIHANKSPYNVSDLVKKYKGE